MFLTIALGSALAVSNPVELSRQFKKGETLNYEVKSHLMFETQVAGYPYFLPEEMDMIYVFTMAVKEIKADGFAEIHYKRPTITIIEGETADSAPVKKTEKPNYDFLLTLSPINEVITMKDLAAKAPAQPPKKNAGFISPFATSGTVSQAGQDILMNFLGELHRLALFVGDLNSSVDLNPKLPFEEVQPGDTWKRTVGYQPQALKGQPGKSAVQRLDYTYTYRGLVESRGKKVHRISVNLDLKTDAAPFINQIYGARASQTGLKGAPMNLKAGIEFDLDPVTCHTLYADAQSSGSFQIDITQIKGEPYVQQRIKGRTEMRLLPSK